MRALALGLITLLLLMWARPAPAEEDAAQRAFDRGDWPRAMALWRPAAKRGDPHAQLYYGRLRLLSPVTDMDGLSWIKKSARAGYIPAEFHMAMLHFHALYVPGDRTDWVRWLKRAAGHEERDSAAHPMAVARARLFLSVSYRAGKGVPKDTSRANELLRESADGGHALAQYHHAELLENGRDGVRKDLAEAHKYYVLAWKQDLEEARPRALAVRKRLSADQFADSKQRIRTWLDAKDRGELGGMFDWERKQPKGAILLRTGEAMNRKVAETVRMMAGVFREGGFEDEKCHFENQHYVLSRKVVAPFNLRTKRWTERWTVDS